MNVTKKRDCKGCYAKKAVLVTFSGDILFICFFELKPILIKNDCNKKLDC